MSKSIIVISGPSGAGKSTVYESILKEFPQLSLSISATTRKIRKGETNGEHYYFLSENEFKQKIEKGEFLEYEEVYPGKFYGTLYNEIDRITNLGKIPLLEVEVKGALNVKKFFPERAFLIFIAPPSFEVLEERLRKRNTETEEGLKIRLARAKYELSQSKRFNVIIENDKLSATLEKANEIVRETFSDTKEIREKQKN